MTDKFIVTILPWFLPPFLGAAIGFITNHLAIRMLFRPLTEKHIFGIRVPFTPGIIPKQRYKLAESIAVMVSERLLTADAVKNQLQSPQFQKALQDNISSLTKLLFEMTLSDFKNTKIPFTQDTWEELINKLLTNFLSSENFYEAAKHLILKLLNSISAKKLKDTVSTLNIRDFLIAKIHSIIHDNELRDWLVKTVTQWVNTQLKENKPLATIIPDDMVEILSQALSSSLPFLLNSLIKWLKTESMKKDLEEKGKLFLNDVLNKLNILQRLFVSVGQYDVTLNQKMPEIIDEGLKYIEQTAADAQNREKIVLSIKQGINEWRTRGLADLFKRSNSDIPLKIQTIILDFWQFMRKKDMSRNIAHKLKDKLLKNQNITLGEIGERFFGLKKANIVTYVMSFIKLKSFASTTAKQITDLLFGFVESKKLLKLNQVVGIDSEKKIAIDNTILSSINKLLASRLPQMIESLNIKELVITKINSLDVAQVESLLLLVIAKQLKWINIFGAILGGIIGLSQLIMKLFQV